MKKIILLIFVMSLFSCTCRSIPEKEDFEYKICFNAMLCSYFIRKSGGNSFSLCSGLVKGCNDAWDEDRRKKRLIFCKKYKLEDMTLNECRLWLNQK